jgi:periplasmic copper chaperone A
MSKPTVRVKSFVSVSRCLRAFLVGLAGATLAAFAVHAHGVKAGDLYIEHPYATPSRPGPSTGAVYFRAIKNNGAEPDRLLAARTPVAASVELHRMDMDGAVMRMRPVAGIDLPGHTEILLRHGAGSGYHVMLQGLKAPLKEGDRFSVVLTFQRAGEHEVQVWVQGVGEPQNKPPHQH